MAQKPVKKTAAKPAAKKAPVKKVAAKKPAVKAAPVADARPTMAAPEMHGCGCGADCKCACRGGSKFGRFVKKLIIALIIFALGFAAAKLCCCDKHHNMRGPRVSFVNGCLDATEITCPKLLEALPAMDINQDGCITRDEYRAVKKQMRREIREMQVEVVE